MRVFRDIGKFQPRSDNSFRFWLNRIADHCIIDAVRSARRKKRGGDMKRVSPDNKSAKGRSPSQSVAGHEAVVAIQIAVAELPTDQRRALQLYWLEDKSLEEVAKELQCSKDAVRGLVDRAKRHLRESLGNSSQWLS
jgi:RNA polymerase sigma-70 factor (ECF subfamily)